MATNPNSSWEVVDGLQRLTSIVNFIGDANQLENTSVTYTKLKLIGLDKLEAMNGICFADLPKSMQIMLLTRPLRVTVLNDRSDFNVRYDLFERLNTGGITLHEQEIRNCIFGGEFNEFIKELSLDVNFRAVVKMTDNAKRNGSYEELVLRFFAYLEDQETFVHSVKGFLNQYMEKKTKSFKNKSQLLRIFNQAFGVIKDSLPDGIVRGSRKNITPIILYEAISVGTALAVKEGKNIDQNSLKQLLDNLDLKKLTTGATNSKKMVFDRIDFVRARL